VIQCILKPDCSRTDWDALLSPGEASLFPHATSRLVSSQSDQCGLGPLEVEVSSDWVRFLTYQCTTRVQERYGAQVNCEAITLVLVMKRHL